MLYPVQSTAAGEVRVKLGVCCKWKFGAQLPPLTSILHSRRLLLFATAVTVANFPHFFHASTPWRAITARSSWRSGTLARRTGSGSAGVVRR